MKIVQVTKRFIYQETSIWSVEQEITTQIYAAVPDILADSTKIILIQSDTAPWFTSGNFLQIWVENMKVEMLALVSSSSEEVRKLIDEYNNYLEQWQKKTANKATIEQLNKLYEL